MGRLVSAGALFYGQADFYFPAGSSSRATGIVAASLSLVVFANNAIVPWTLADGSAVLDSSISAGVVYFSEIVGAPGYYSVRLFPDRVASWRVALSSAFLSQQAILDFDALPPGVLRPSAGGLNAIVGGGC